MTAFATPEDLQLILGRPLADAEYLQSLQLLDFASDAIRTYCRQTLSLVANDVVTLRGTANRVLSLPERPVVSVAQVKIANISVSSAAYWLAQDDLIWGGNPLNVGNLPDYGWSGWGGDATTLTITYSHGFATVPGSVKLACCQIALRISGNPTGVISETVGSYSVTFAGRQGSPGDLTEGEKLLLRRFRRTWL